MFGFINKVFVVAISFFSGITFSGIILSGTPLKSVSMNNQECNVISQIISININEPVFFPLSIKSITCNGSCKNINDPYAKMCIPDAVKYLNVKVFKLMSRTNETRQIE